MSAVPGNTLYLRRSFHVVLAAIVLSIAVMACSPSGKKASFRSVDGYLLRARTYGEGSTAVILASAKGQDAWRSSAKRLASEGYAAITFDFRGHEGSEGSKDLHLLDRDILGAIRFAKKQGSTKIVVVGEGLGGTAALIAASKTDIGGVVTLSAPAESSGLDAGPILSNISSGKMFIAAVGDKKGAADAKSMLRASLDPDADLVLLPGDVRGVALLGVNDKKAYKALLEFLSDL